MAFMSQRHRIEWRFIPTRAPHFEGLWEAGVKSVKYHFYRVASNSTLNYEEFQLNYTN